MMSPDTFYIVFFLVVAVGAAIIAAYVDHHKGDIGEQKVANRLAELPKGEYETLNNLILKTSRGTTQIDHVVVSRYGIFVIETKNYDGWIYGGERSQSWTQNIYGEKYKFLNPIIQNEGHVKAVAAAVAAVGKFKIFPVVVFSNNAELKSKVPEYVMNRHRLLKYIFAQNVECMSAEQMAEVVSALQGKDISDEDGIARERHKEYVKSVSADAERKLREGVCPRCGAQLVVRHGKFGDFYGCSRYPHCRYTHDC